METEKHTFQNDILKNIKENDIVMVRMESRYEANTRNLIRLTNITFIPAGEEYDGITLDYDWIKYDADVLYTNKRMHSSWLDKGVGNCLAITEIVPEELVDNYIKTYNMFDAKKHTISDEEAEQNYRKEMNMLKHL